MAKGTVNKVILLGRLGITPEVRTTQNGTTVATLSLATNDGMGENITTEWHRVVVFGKAAEIIQKYGNKGSQLFIEGRLRTNKWQDKNGNTQYSTEVVASNFQFIGGSNAQGDTNYNNEQTTNNFHQQKTQQDNIPDFAEITSPNFDDDIPF
ncbi:single-stranded DNA-binding protein [Allofrancisella guangzhouensis]|uniref:Single-stranded DNA-binding protein n=1 Tax=Allofrancisella guangzhouensis TaxID=594679 RepID=A0A0A8E408_9GAMM|nr:single-stranded DNA-binding protein [Allofrancisella guangzhouensis]AJC48347.1 single-stranded DNA-binding protein [Allofrancisella guangzhouensis]MBK2026561.1 single-stranded DNA-binding protein [Allofrancisella guangzhouensis]MBK2044305.1 single-stranded DNA-binding protein [Allofrancisella guangzhouensis]MBK2045548.1 single-stranded DNA-binding protein [Allofrancisella guangzhouensis]